MLHLLYLLAFSSLAILAIGNLIRNLMVLGTENQRYSPSNASASNPNGLANNAAEGRTRNPSTKQPITLHPEMLDEKGRPIREPLLVMKSMTVDDARDHLDSLFQSSPEGPSQDPE